MTIFEQIKESYDQVEDKQEFIAEVKALLFSLSDMKHNPVDLVRWVHIDQIQANDYNPNSVATIEMQLLYTSIDHDGYTQPIVTIYDEVADKFIIVDGFHRYFVLKANEDIYQKNNGMLPIVVIDKDINDRMASTVRHNRARGKHSVNGMANMVFEMLDNGWQDHDICNELGMEPEELLRLKHITGFSKLFEDTEYKRAWMVKRQIEIKREYTQEKKNGNSTSK
jgi:ParB-like chromosome segregation protein Spo0J